ncbi:tail fiber domain-containing protein [Citrobacter amalonaticus]|uniref:tail fiber domain-containing protein n=1 Tax=Citrobacter amalonaticus TaxID=35703 RepID=UPI001140700A|nr:tail fiber domain-containing protein [Citrobacter amalonaticus]
MVGAGGGLGPTLNGVQNFGVGQPALWTSRAFIPAWSVVADGQILNRADWPELWAHAQMHTPISDADWLANPGKRGNYSDGDGATTFRVPDFNGVQSGSIPGLFGRGDQGGLLPSGNVYESAAPDIAGTLNFRQVRAPAGELNNNLVGSGGAFSTSTGTTGQYGPISLNGTLATALQLLSFKASDSNPVYGRSANQVWPNSFVGVWIIRASGGFTAANTSWTVYNGDDVAPPVNTTTNGGAIRSEYQIGGTMASALSLTAQYTELASGIRARAQLAAASANDSYLWWFNSNGDVVSSDGRFHYSGVINPTGNVEITGDEFSSFIVEDRRSADADGVGKWWSFALDGNYGAYFIKRRRNGVNTGQIVINMPSASGTIALQGTSGLAYKHSVKDADLAEAVGRIDALRMVNFVYNDDEQNRERFGFIAEEAEQVAPQYIKHNSEPTADILDKDGNKIGEETRDRPSVDNNPIVMDLLGYVKHLKAEIEMLKTALTG